MEKNVEIHSHSQADLNPLGCVSCESEEVEKPYFVIFLIALYGLCMVALYSSFFDFVPLLMRL